MLSLQLLLLSSLQSPTSSLSLLTLSLLRLLIDDHTDAHTQTHTEAQIQEKGKKRN